QAVVGHELLRWACAGNIGRDFSRDRAGTRRYLAQGAGLGRRRPVPGWPAAAGFMIGETFRLVEG
ncbi:MAG TPA: hypothetical protein VN767_07420, partial [Streptosporangiaceae bacterium]|nr:hypothetical protein [Streptosporangiaceae bacterium]